MHRFHARSFRFVVVKFDCRVRLYNWDTSLENVLHSHEAMLFQSAFGFATGLAQNTHRLPYS